MSGLERFKARSSALLIMDFQNILLEQFLTPVQAETVLAKTAELLEMARKADIEVIYVTVGFRNGYPEISTGNTLFKDIASKGYFLAGKRESEIHHQLVPLQGEIVVLKHRVSAFHGTELDLILRARNIDSLIITGILTSGVVLSTTVQAADKDYCIVIAGECCADADGDAHIALLKNILPLHAQVFSNDELHELIDK